MIPQQHNNLLQLFHSIFRVHLVFPRRVELRGGLDLTLLLDRDRPLQYLSLADRSLAGRLQFDIGVDEVVFFGGEALHVHGLSGDRLLEDVFTGGR